MTLALAIGAGQALTISIASAARAEQATGITDRPAKIDKRPIGATPEPYDLDALETSVGSMSIVPGDPATFELFGFKLGMSVREADRNARRRQLRFNGGNGTGPSFDSRVAVTAARLLGQKPPKPLRVLQSTSMVDTSGNRYNLRFLPMEGGATLSSILYVGSLEGNTTAQYLAALEARFGKPTHVGNSRWCSKGDRVLAICEELPFLSAIPGTEVALSLGLGSRARRDLDRRVEAKAAAVAGTQRRTPSF